MEQENLKKKPEDVGTLGMIGGFIVIIVLIFIVVKVLFFIWGAISNGSDEEPAIENVSGPESVMEEAVSSPMVSEVERSKALKQVAETVDKDQWTRSEVFRTYEDVYKNPKGDGYIVWLSNDDSTSMSYLYLVKSEEVYGITPDSKIMSPSITLTTDVTIDDLGEIKEWRMANLSMRYIACNRHATILERNGVVPKLVDDQRNACEAKYNN